MDGGMSGANQRHLIGSAMDRFRLSSMKAVVAIPLKEAL
jgi:hypothetical protein